MDRERIERLAMDSALGELGEDAMALFEAYVAAYPQANEWARQMQRTCAVAQEAIAVTTRAPRQKSFGARRHRYRLRCINRPALGRWAAVVAVSLLAGAGVGRWSARQDAGSAALAPVTVVRAEPAAKSWQELLSEPGQGLWQAKALALLGPASLAPAGLKTGENVWEKYRRYLREK